MKYIYNDGGRKTAGYQGSAGDCVIRAISIATSKPYQQVYDDLFAMNKNDSRIGGKSPRNGKTSKKTIREYLEKIGWKWIPAMMIGSGCRMHLNDELPMGRIIARVSKHLVAVIDHTIQDTHNPSRGGTRCVYGYYQEKLST